MRFVSFKPQVAVALLQKSRLASEANRFERLATRLRATWASESASNFENAPHGHELGFYFADLLVNDRGSKAGPHVEQALQSIANGVVPRDSSSKLLLGYSVSDEPLRASTRALAKHLLQNGGPKRLADVYTALENDLQGALANRRPLVTRQGLNLSSEMAARAIGDFERDVLAAASPDGLFVPQPLSARDRHELKRFLLGEKTFAHLRDTASWFPREKWSEVPKVYLDPELLGITREENELNQARFDAAHASLSGLELPLATFASKLEPRLAGAKMKSHTLLAIDNKPGRGFHTDQAFAQRADNPQLLRAIATMNTGELKTGTEGFAAGKAFTAREGELILFFGELVRRQLKLDGYVPLTHASPFEGGRGVKGRRTGVWTTFVDSNALKPA